MDNPLAGTAQMFPRAMPWQGNESELRLALTQKNLVASTVKSKPGSSVAGTNRISTIFQEIAVARPKARRVAFGIRLFWD